MDQGARYYNCDFQVHSPRDNQWQGERPATEEDRRQYGQKFIAAYRERKLDAVAITDHHDLCFFPFIKAAAAGETDARGNPVPNHRRIVVFPGMELTLAVPCQALLIFDADIPVDVLPNVFPLLGVPEHPHDQPIHVQAVRLDAITTFDHLCSLLDRNNYFIGRYIILPSVTDGGHGSMMRNNFTTLYKNMPCVGGYVDGSVSKIGSGTRRILDGKIDGYGFKRLGLFQTSDNRCAKFSKFGEHTTWVKWATPTAEALRQACLACDTRISHESPVIPSMVITQLEVSNSRFLGGIDLHFNPQYNCLIGGRGTGKSTSLEYIRWALCDQPPGYTDEDDAATYQERRVALIEKTLVPCEGVVTVSFLLDSVPHVVRRSPKTKEVGLKIGPDDYKVCTEADIRDLLPLQAYSQKQLSAVGVRTDELVRFIRTPIKAELDNITAEIERQKAITRQHYSQLTQKRKMVREQVKEQLELASVAQRLNALRLELKGVSEEDQKVLVSHDPFLQEEQEVNKLSRNLEQLREMATDFRKSLDALPSAIRVADSMPNLALVAQIREALERVVATSKSNIDALVKLLSVESLDLSQYTTLSEQCEGAFATHNARYGKAKQDASSKQSQLRLIDEAEAKIKQLRTSVTQRQSAIEQLGDPEESFRAARLDWVGAYRNLADVLSFKCSELTILSTERIKAELRRGAGVHKVKDRVIALLTGTKIRTKKTEDLCDAVSKSSDPLSEWSEVMNELEQFVDYSNGEADEPKPKQTPHMTGAGFTVLDLQKVSHKLTPEEWLELSLTEIEDIPAFEYRQSPGLYIQFADASAGQQATALLQVLLNQQGPPLIIDQPEEDLDNQIVLDIVKDIWRAKKGRQIIFSSHNPNIVVNGDADLVVCCDYRTAGDHSGGMIKYCGAIDVPEIKHEITTVMEGGRDAFRLRKEKYGF